MEITRTTLTVMVDDFDRSVGFYTQHLGFVVEYSAAPHFAMLNRAGLRLGVHPRGTNPSAGGCDGLSVGFEVPDVDLAVSELQRQGVVFPSGVRREGPLSRADFSDPDGVSLYLFQMHNG